MAKKGSSEWKGPAVTRKKFLYDKRTPGGDNLCYPHSDYSIHPSDRFVFFSSLYSAANSYDEDGTNTAFVEGANKLVTNVKAQLSDIQSQLNTITGVDEAEKTLSAVSQSIEFLNNAIEYERANEVGYFTNQLHLLQSSFPKAKIREMEQIINTFNSMKANATHALDYAAFTDVINKLKYNLEDTAQIYEKEIKRLEQTDIRYKKIIDDMMPKVKAGSHKSEQRKLYMQNYRARSAERKSIVSQYYNAYEKYLKTMSEKFGVQVGPTIENQMADFINETIQNISSNRELMDRICSFLEDKGVVTGVRDGNYEQYSSEVTSFLINALTQQINKNWRDSKQYTLIKTTIINQFIKNFDDAAEAAYKQMEHIVGGRKVSRTKLGRSVQKTSDITGKGLANFFMNFISEHGSDSELFRDEIAPFLGTQEDINEIVAEAKRLLTLSGNGHIYSDRYVKSQKADSNSFEYEKSSDGSGKLLTTLKGELSKMIHQKIGKFAEQQIEKGKGPLDFSASMAKALGLLKTSISGPALQEFLNLISVSGDYNNVAIHIGGKEKKTDSIIITLDYSKISGAVKKAVSQAQPLWSDIAQVFYEKYKVDAASSYDKWSYQGGYSGTITDKNGKERPMNERAAMFLDKNGNLDEQALARFEANMPGTGELKALTAFRDSIAETIAKLKADIKDTEELKKILNNLGNSFYLSSTDKTYNYYQDDLGFMGGSLGVDIGTQLININRLYTIGGLTPIDINLLIFAAMNSANSATLGDVKLKHSIENYCSTVAGFMMFDEGAAEMEILKEKASGILSDTTTPKILHLYHLNGTYVPGSYILTRIRDGIADMQKIYSTGAQNFKAKDGAFLSSSLRSDDYQYGYQETTKEAEWANVSITASNRIELRFVFLAGMVDMLHQLNEAANNINKT